MTALEQIDFVFFYIKEHTQFGGNVSDFAVKDRVDRTPETNITETMRLEIIKRLKSDGYVSEATVEDSQPFYHLTFQGVLFDGYKKAKEESQKEELRLQTLADQNLLVAKKVKNLTIWIAVATVVAGFYGILQIIDWFCSHHH